MRRNHTDVQDHNRGNELPDGVLQLFSESPNSVGEQTRPPDKCAACDETAGIQWLRMVTDWEDYLSTHRDVSSPESVCLIPLCNRCRAWAEIIEIAEMAVPQLPDGEANRILQERDHFLESLDVHLVRGLRVSHQLESFNE